MCRATQLKHHTIVKIILEIKLKHTTTELKKNNIIIKVTQKINYVIAAKIPFPLNTNS